MSITITKEITVDVATPNVFQAIVAKQFDTNSRFLKVTIANSGQAIHITQGSDVTINARRPDGASAPFTGSVNDDGTVTVPLSPWMLYLDGMVKCDISIIGDDIKLTTLTFQLNVQSASYDPLNPDPETDPDDLLMKITKLSDMFLDGITEDNNGQILMVVNGELVPTDFPAGTQYDARVVTIAVANWSVDATTGTITAQYDWGFKVDGLSIDVSLVPSAEAFEAAGASGVYCSGTNGNWLLFAALYAVPTIDLSFNIRVTKSTTLSYVMDDETMTLTVMEDDT